MNKFASANTEWSNCLNAEGDWSWDVDEFGYSQCTTDDIDATLQLFWSQASGHLDTARGIVDAIGTRTDGVNLGTDDIPTDTPSVDGSIYGAIAEKLCATDVPLTATEPCTDLKAILGEGVEDGELERLNGALKVLGEAYG